MSSVKAVQVLLDSRGRLNAEKSNGVDVKADGNAEEDNSLKVDPIQVSCFYSWILQSRECFIRQTNISVGKHCYAYCA